MVDISSDPYYALQMEVKCIASWDTVGLCCYTIRYTEKANSTNNIKHYCTHPSPPAEGDLGL